MDEPGAIFDDRPSGGARRDRTDDLMLAKHALSQLSYGPKLKTGAAAPSLLGVGHPGALAPQGRTAAAHVCARAKVADATAGD